MWMCSPLVQRHSELQSSGAPGLFFLCTGGLQTSSVQSGASIHGLHPSKAAFVCRPKPKTPSHAAFISSIGSLDGPASPKNPGFFSRRDQTSNDAAGHLP